MYLNLHKLGMHCEECGLALDGVNDDQIVKAGKFSRIRFYCEKHKPLELFI